MKEGTQHLAYELFKDINPEDLEYIYRGYFTPSITQNILLLTEANVEKSDDPSLIKKRLYFLMVEGMQNITRHQDQGDSDLKEGYSVFFIQRRNKHYYITTGNLIQTRRVGSLREKLETINKLDKNELKKYYKRILRTGGISDKGGAGLGLIDMARKSGNKLLYDFKPINEDFSYFYFQTELPTSKLETDGEQVSVQQANEKDSLEMIKEYHQILNQENIQISFKGSFTQENLVHLLSLIEGQLSSAPSASSKSFSMMIELLQNIVKHASNKGNPPAGNLGIFYLSHKQTKLYLTAGNFIENKEIQPLNDELEYVNSLNYDELDDYYNRVLLDFGNTNAKKTGLGFLDMRIKSRQKIDFEFRNIDQHHSFFSLSIGVPLYDTNITPLEIDPTHDTPKVIFKPEINQFLIAGDSFPDDPAEFYKPLFEWMERYIQNPNPESVFIFDIDIVNTTSSKQLIHLMQQIQKASLKSQVQILWYYDKNDEDNLSLGLRYKQLIKVDFEMREK